METRSVVLEGGNELAKLLTELGPRVERNITRTATKKAALVLIPAIEQRAMRLTRTKKRTGDLVASIGMRVKNYSKNGAVFVAIGPLYPKGAHGWLVEHGHRMVVGGTVMRATGKRAGKTATAYSLKHGDRTGKGRIVGRVPGYPFAATAFRAVGAKMLSTMEEYHRSRVEREAAKLAKEVRAI